MLAAVGAVPMSEVKIEAVFMMDPFIDALELKTDVLKNVGTPILSEKQKCRTILLLDVYLNIVHCCPSIVVIPRLSNFTLLFIDDWSPPNVASPSVDAYNIELLKLVNRLLSDGGGEGTYVQLTAFSLATL